jgi:site-specific DNA recombinase
LTAQQRQLDAAAGQRLELRAVADGIEAFCQTIRAGLTTATFAQRRQLVELLIDRVVVTDGEVEIRYVLPTSPDGPHPPFCQLRKDHLDGVAVLVVPGVEGGRAAARAATLAAVVLLVFLDRDDGLDAALAQVAAVGGGGVGLVTQRGAGPGAGPPLAPAPDGQLVHQRDELRAVTVLARRGDAGQRPAAPVSDQVNLGGKTAP